MAIIYDFCDTSLDSSPCDVEPTVLDLLDYIDILQSAGFNLRIQCANSNRGNLGWRE